MAPTERQVEWQTSQIIRFLLEDEDASDNRGFGGHLECDAPGKASDDDDFDPVVIADKLRSVADALNDDPKFRAALTDLKQAAAQEAVEKAFSHGVQALCQTQVSQVAEVAQEMQIIRASVALGLYVKKSSPELKSKVQRAMNAFLTRRVGPWVAQQGGWEKVVQH